MRIIGYPGAPFGPLRDFGKRTRLASLSATASCVPSMTTTSLPANRVTWCAPVTAGPLTRVNNSRSGATPTRRIASLNAEADGLFTGSGNPATRREKTCFQP